MAVSIFGIPNDPVVEELNPSEVQYRHASKIIISYPSFDDWRKVYDPGDLFKRFNDPRYSPAAHQSMRRDHERGVLKQLNLILPYATGKAVLNQLNIGPPWTVRIHSYDLAPLSLLQKEMLNQFKAAASTMSAYRDDRSFTEPSLQGSPICGKRRDGIWACTKVLGTGNGSDVDIYFAPSRVSDSLFGPDEGLLHELVHAGRILHGKVHDRQVSGSYGNEEEFVAQLVQNIYRSERGRPPFDYNGFPIDGSKFLNSRSTRDHGRVGVAARQVL